VVASVAVSMPIVASDLVAGLPIVALLGAVTAGTTIRLAQTSQRRSIRAATSHLEVEQGEALAMLEGEAV
jgi:hypothetical protein